MAHDVFISYSSKNKQTADAVVAHLESRGIRCWYAPRDIQPGADWAESIIDGLSSAKVLVLIYTDDSNDSEQVLREAAYAADIGLVIVPFRLSSNKPNDKLKSYLKNTHWLDAVDRDLAVSIQKLGRRCDAVLDNISKQNVKIEMNQQRSVLGKVFRILFALIGVLLAIVIVFTAISSLGEEKHVDPSDSRLVSSIDQSKNGITMIHLSDSLICNTGNMTCNDFTQAFLDGMEAAAGGHGYEAVRSDNSLGIDIYKNGKKTPFSMAFMDGDNAIVTGDKQFCTVGIMDNEDPGHNERVKAAAALILAAYPDISTRDAEELAAVMCNESSPVHAWSGVYELYCEIGSKFSFTILNSERYND